jgi:DNA-binding MarR family transcriptional regulator
MDRVNSPEDPSDVGGIAVAKEAPDAPRGAAAPAAGDSLLQMAEEIFSLTVMGWRERVASKGQGSAELSESQYLAVDALMRSPGTLTVGEIQRAIGVMPAQMSRIMRSLETGFDKSLVRCELNQTDKRKIDVKLTAEGKRVYEHFRNAKLVKTVDILRQLEDKDRLEFIRICRRIRELFEFSPASADREDSKE